MRGFPIAGFVVAASLIAGACSSSSSSNSAFDGGPVDVSTPQPCDDVIALEANTLPTGTCDASKAASCVVDAEDSCTGTGTNWLCRCSGGAWSCSITGGSLSGCDMPIADSGSDAASDADAFDASDGDAS